MSNRAFDHVLIIMFENQYRSYVMENTYMQNLAQQGIDMANYFGVMHPSQTNYIASLAGELCNVTYDTQPQPFPLPQRTVVDLIEESPYNLSWRAYMDSYIKQNQPWAPNFVPKDEFPYLVKHNPFSSFKTIVDNRDRWEKVEDEAGLWKDLINGTFPEYAWFTPNMWNDGHYLNGTQTDPEERAPALVDQLAIWLESFFDALRFPGPDSHLPRNTLVVVTFDESDFEKAYDADDKYTYDGPNQIYTVLLGDMIRPGVQQEGYNHYSLIKTIEKNFGLASLEKNDHDANWFRFLWGKRFEWGSPRKTWLKTNGSLAAAEYQGILYLVYEGDDGALCFSTFDDGSFSDPRAIGQSTTGLFALATCGGQLVLVYQTDSSLSMSTYTLETGWSTEPVTVMDETVAAIALTAYNHGQNLMLAYRISSNDIYSLSYEKGQWASSAVSVGFQSDGHVALAVLGPSLYLIYKVVGCSKMGVVSYNTAPFNAVTVAESKYSGPYDNTTQNTWCLSSFPVAHFSSAANSVTPGEEEPVTQIYRGSGPLTCATLDGVIHLAHCGQSNPLVLTETFSISGIMTPEKPISYNKSDQTTTSNGYGTLAEAGWSEQVAINGVYHESEKAMCMATSGDSVLLIYQPDDCDEIHICRGEYR